jgi:hypothetical protein
MPPAKKYQKREANLGGLIEKLELMQEELGGNGNAFQFMFARKESPSNFIGFEIIFISLLSEQKRKKKRRRKLMSLPV